jgi:hypothetical protein
VRVERDEVKPGTHRIEFSVRAVGAEKESVREKSVFIVR